MEKEKLIAKLNIKDYNKELEKILLKKTFSKATKNLLLSMLYKIENSYEDYKKVKVDVISKKEFLENLLKIIERDCKEIEIIKPDLEGTSVLGSRKSMEIVEEQKIISYQNELAILEAIYKLNTDKFTIEGEEEIKSEALSKLFNMGEAMQNSEVIRDFDGWSWNVMTENSKDYTASLVYQGMIYLIGYEDLNQNKKIDMQTLENLLKEKYKPSLAEKIFTVINQIAVLKYIEEKPEKCEYLQDRQEKLQNSFELMNDKKAYIEKITNKKKECIKEIENIDKYINDDLALKKEYIKQNEHLPQEERVFSLSDFSEKVQTRREELTNQIEESIQKLKPNNYVKEKNKIEKNLNFIKELHLENPDVNIFIEEFIKLLLKALSSQMDTIEQKKDVIEKIYILRYLSLFNIDEQTLIGIKHKKELEKVEKKIITMACNFKILNIFSEDVEENYKIYKNIFTTKIIDLENVYIELNKDNVVKIYDENSLEKEEQYAEFKDLIVKYNKRIKIFL